MRQPFYVFLFLEAGTSLEKPACLRFCTNTETTMLSVGTKTLSHCLLLEVDPPAWVMNPKCCDPRFRKVRWWGLWGEASLEGGGSDATCVYAYLACALSGEAVDTSFAPYITASGGIFWGLLNRTHFRGLDNSKHVTHRIPILTQLWVKALLSQGKSKTIFF